MDKNPALSALAVVLVGALLSLVAAPASAATSILTPAGTKVHLTILDSVDTASAARGDKVRFKVAADVVVEDHVVIKRGAVLTGTIKEVGHPFPQNAGFASISLPALTAVDKKRVSLKDIRISAPIFGGNIRVSAGTLMTTSTKADVMVDVP